jgi:Rrf2 family cysteine metabolism transcriptional repressor
MRISTSGRYALRAMLDLAIHGTGNPVSRQEIADRQQISSEYIAQLFRPLNKENLVTSVMGPGGGYILNRLPETIRIGDIIRSVEGPLAVVYCVQPGTENPCDRITTCPTHVIWTRLTRVIEEYLDSVTLKDLMVIAQDVDPMNSTNCPDPVGAIINSMEITVDQPDCFSNT